MKMNIKKVATVLGSALMLGATVGMAAAAAYPAPFVQGGAANVAIVYGANAANADILASSAIATGLATTLAAQTATGATVTSASTVEGGDSYKIEKSSQKFWLGTNVNTIRTSLDDTQLPNLLAEGKFVDSDNDEFDYKQSINLSNNLQLEMFNDRTYKADTPTLGFFLGGNEEVLSYTLEMTDKPYFNKLETTDLPIMGKMYYVLDVSSTNDTLTLLDAANNAVVTEGESSTLAVGDKSYELSVWVGQSGSDNIAKVTVNGQTTNSLKAGQTQRLSDGSYIGIKDIMYSSKESAVSKVELSIGSGKLKIVNTSKVELNDETVKNVYGYIDGSSTQLEAIRLTWKTEDKTFITKDTELAMPGFGAVKLSFGGVNFPKEEAIVVDSDGDNNLILADFPLSEGAVDIPFLGKADGNANFTYIGSDTDALVVTSPTSTVTFDGTSSSNDDFMIVSWSDGTDAESYLVRAINFNDVTTGDDTVDFEVNDGSGWTTTGYKDLAADDELSLGSNIDLTFAAFNATTGNETVTLSRGSSTEIQFDVLYSKEGLTVQMPWLNSTSIVNTTAVPTCPAAKPGEIQNFVITNSSGSNVLTTCANKTSTFALELQEENKDEDIAAGQKFNVTLGITASPDYLAEVSSVSGANSTREKSATDIYESWLYSPLATKMVEDNSGDQGMVTITYHGGESFGDVYVNAPGAKVVGSTTGSTTGATQLGTITVKDSEVTSVSGKNLIVIGGSCVNSVAADLLGGAACEAAFTAKTGIKAGEALIKSFAKGDKIALLVAGYNAEDTTKAATYLVNKGANTTVGAALKVTSATEATAITA